MLRTEANGHTQPAESGRFCLPIPEQLAAGKRPPPPFIIDAAAADMIVDRLGEALDAALEGVPPPDQRIAIVAATCCSGDNKRHG